MSQLFPESLSLTQAIEMCESIHQTVEETGTGDMFKLVLLHAAIEDEFSRMAGGSMLSQVVKKEQ